MHPNSRSLTLTASSGGLLNVLVSDCNIGPSFDPNSTPTPPIDPPGLVTFQAIWDTGATGCVITPSVVAKCGLKPTGMTMASGLNSSRICETYLVCLALPNKITFPSIKVIMADLPGGGPDILIGMDVITLGDFSITNKGGNTVFSFRVPSELNTDFVREHNRQLSLDMLRGAGRNGPAQGGKPRRHK